MILSGMMDKYCYQLSRAVHETKNPTQGGLQKCTYSQKHKLIVSFIKNREFLNKECMIWRVSSCSFSWVQLCFYVTSCFFLTSLEMSDNLWSASFFVYKYSFHLLP